ncbi:MAG: pirin family protein [Alphaproteobacteria bacterium]|nr:pirin family protein [Alphaproteobacteria bacterium]
MTDVIELIIAPRERDIGDLVVRRVLPSAKRQMVGPFIFFDHYGPVDFEAGTGIDVRPHPHIGLATVTYLFEGAMTHRDSLGVVQEIHPGDVNWMTAGRGIAHSERTGPAERSSGQCMHGIQSWVALPRQAEDAEPEFHHHPADSLPSIERDDVRMRLIAGTAFGETSPVETPMDTFYLDVDMPAISALTIPEEHAERAIYVVDGAISIGDHRMASTQLAVLSPGLEVTVHAEIPSKLMLLGGAQIDGKRLIWWNFVASSQQRIDRAKEDWANNRFPKIHGESDFIPLPKG